MKATGIVRRVDDPLLKTLTPSDGYLWAMGELAKRCL